MSQSPVDHIGDANKMVRAAILALVPGRVE